MLPPVEVYRLRDEAIQHKRAARRHQRLARLKMEELARFCATHGIELVNLSLGEQKENFDGHHEHIVAGSVYKD